MTTSRPRPIHTTNRQINHVPDSNEPAGSFEDKTTYMNDRVISEAEHYHLKEGNLFRCPLRSSHPSASKNQPQANRRRSSELSQLVGGNASVVNSPVGDFKSSVSFSESEAGHAAPTSPLQGSLSSPGGAAIVEDDAAYLSEEILVRIGTGANRSTESVGPAKNNSETKDQPHLPRMIRHGSSSSLARKKNKKKSLERDKARRNKHSVLSGDIENGHDSTQDVEQFGFGDEESLASFGTSGLDFSEALTDQGKWEGMLKQFELARSAHGKKKLILQEMGLSLKEIPTDEICSHDLGPDLHKLSLAGNDLIHVPERLTLELTGLRTLDLSQCKLVVLPRMWDLPNLLRLDLSHNRLKIFLEEDMLSGLPSLEKLDLNDNNIDSFIIPDGDYLQNLEFLNLDFNHITMLPDELPNLGKLSRLMVSNNLITHVPEAVCNMPLKKLSVLPNPLIQPPLEDCERGVDGMRRYYSMLSEDKQSAAPKVQKRKREKKCRTKKVGSKQKKQSQSPKKHHEPSPAQDLPQDLGSHRPMHEKSAEATTKKQPTPDITPDITSPQAPQKKSTSHSKPTVTTKEQSALPNEIFGVEDGQNKDLIGHQYEETSNFRSAKTDKIISPDIKISNSVLSDHQKSDFSSLGKPAETSLFETVPAAGEAELLSGYVPESLLVEPKWDLGGIGLAIDEDSSPLPPQTVVNDTLKVIFVGCAYAGKTSIIRRLKDGEFAKLPKVQERTIGVNIVEWDAGHGGDNSIDSRILQECPSTNGNTPNIKFSVWDFAGQNSYLATHEIFFSQRALYVLVWDMAASNSNVDRRRRLDDDDEDSGAFRLDEDSSDDENEYRDDEESLRCKEALERDIDEKVQFWVNCIQSCVPGSAILPVASFDDYFDDLDNGGPEEAERRCLKMKERLLFHERRRVLDLKKRLEKLSAEHKANSTTAERLRHLLSNFNRPKLLVGGQNDVESVIRVSGKYNRGFDELRKKIVGLATGRDKPVISQDGECRQMAYPLFRGHVGSAIPRIRLMIREIVRKYREEFKVVEWHHFLSMLREETGDEKMPSADHISDALNFLSNIGELSYFGTCAMVPSEDQEAPRMSQEGAADDQVSPASRPDTVQVLLSGLSQFIFLNPRWLAVAVGCIIRHDLTQEIDATRRLIANKEDPTTPWQCVGRGGAVLSHAMKNCPIITADDACLLWRVNKKINRAANRARTDSTSSPNFSPFQFLIELLVHFNVFVPIDLRIEKAVMDGKNFAISKKSCDVHSKDSSGSGCSYFLPSKLEGVNANEGTWSYKTDQFWRTCLCHSWTFPDGVPPGLMERIIASVLRSLNCDCEGEESDCEDEAGSLFLREIFCWRTAFQLGLSRMVFDSEHNVEKRSDVDIWGHLVDQESPFCVAGESAAIGTRRLLISAKGPEGDGGRRIWKGGFRLVTDTVDKVMSEYGGLDYDRHWVCPDCLADDIRRAKMWDEGNIRDARHTESGKIRCENGHQIDIQLVDKSARRKKQVPIDRGLCRLPTAPFSKWGAVVLVGLWHGEVNRIVHAGTGFVIDSKRGLIVTASHNVINMDSGPSFGSRHFGLKKCRIVIGVVVDQDRNQRRDKCVSPQAYFKYFAEIVGSDIPRMDACVLRIKEKMESLVGGDGSGIENQSTCSLVLRHLEGEHLQKIKATNRFEVEEEIRMLGYGQGGEGITKTPRLNRVGEVNFGRIVKVHNPRELLHPFEMGQCSFKPTREIVINCQNVGGHSGGPCVNRAGEVIGILSRSDPVDKHRCYLVPTSEYLKLVRRVALEMCDEEGAYGRF